MNQSKFGPFYPSTQRPEGSSPCLSIKLHFWPLSGHSLHHAHGLLFRSSIYLSTTGLWPCWDCPLGCPSPSLPEQPQRCWSSVLASLDESLVPWPSMCHPPCCAFCSSLLAAWESPGPRAPVTLHVGDFPAGLHWPPGRTGILSSAFLQLTLCVNMKPWHVLMQSVIYRSEASSRPQVYQGLGQSLILFGRTWVLNITNNVVSTQWMCVKWKEGMTVCWVN